MNLQELEAIEHPPVVVSNLDIFSPLIGYCGEDGTIPFGTLITITGEPGTGKTKYALQVLDHISAYNEVQCIFNGYEQIPAAIAQYAKSMKLRHINNFELYSEVPAIRTGQVHVIDSLDAFASTTFDSNYPDNKLANWLKINAERSNIIFSIHHKTKGGGRESGSSKFNQYTSCVIELKKSGKEVIATTSRKNRYPGSVNRLVLQHTAAGLILAPTALEKFAGFMQGWGRK